MGLFKKSFAQVVARAPTENGGGEPVLQLRREKKKKMCLSLAITSTALSINLPTSVLKSQDPPGDLQQHCVVRRLLPTCEELNTPADQGNILYNIMFSPFSAFSHLERKKKKSPPKFNSSIPGNTHVDSYRKEVSTERQMNKCIIVTLEQRVHPV